MVSWLSAGHLVLLRGISSSSGLTWLGDDWILNEKSAASKTFGAYAPNWHTVTQNAFFCPEQTRPALMQGLEEQSLPFNGTAVKSHCKRHGHEVG